jgi:hypothetical protein
VVPNPHNSGVNQPDASFGLTAGVAEALLQSHADEFRAHLGNRILSAT